MLVETGYKGLRFAGLLLLTLILAAFGWLFLMGPWLVLVGLVFFGLRATFAWVSPFAWFVGMTVPCFGLLYAGIDAWWRARRRRRGGLEVVDHHKPRD